MSQFNKYNPFAFKNTLIPEVGMLLISNPMYGTDIVPSARAVVLITGITSKMTSGLLLNLTLSPTSLDEEMLQEKVQDKILYFGGEYKRTKNRETAIHNIQEFATIDPYSRLVMKDMFVTTSVEMLRKQKLEEQETYNTFVRYFKGQTCWKNEDLDSEIINQNWYVAALPTIFIVNSNPLDLWRDSVLSLKSVLGSWLIVPPMPFMN